MERSNCPMTPRLRYVVLLPFLFVFPLVILQTEDNGWRWEAEGKGSSGLKETVRNGEDFILAKYHLIMYLHIALPEYILFPCLLSYGADVAFPTGVVVTCYFTDF
ncbi:hypothetical protein COLO4_07831 [Corchorus olitorius]|uniref:Transmembrane protein n=1 Tax=Corchorus olitorius TaxID=93759 RepID=A0A1R3KIF9_9ROSI|nr:hypothetical protein COLO4_07831 [Corchorus olitorius]